MCHSSWAEKDEDTKDLMRNDTSERQRILWSARPELEMRPEWLINECPRLNFFPENVLREPVKQNRKT